MNLVENSLSGRKTTPLTYHLSPTCIRHQPYSGVVLTLRSLASPTTIWALAAWRNDMQTTKVINARTLPIHAPPNQTAGEFQTVARVVNPRRPDFRCW